MNWFWRNKPSKEVTPTDPRFDWTLDSGFLNWIVAKKIADFTDLVLKPKMENNDMVIPVNDETVNGYVEMISTEILGMFSERYKAQMSKYVAPEMLGTLVIDILYSQILELGIQANIKKMRKARAGGITDETEFEKR